MTKFWLVYVEGKSAPVHKHLNKSAAVAEAGRLFNLERKRAYVLEAVGYHDMVGSAYHETTLEEPEPPAYVADEVDGIIPLTRAEIDILRGGKPQFIPAIKELRKRTKCSLVDADNSCRYHLMLIQMKKL